MSLADRVGVDRYANMIIRNAINHLNGETMSVYPMDLKDNTNGTCGSVEFLYRSAAYHRRNGLRPGPVLGLFVEAASPQRPKLKKAS